MRSQGKAAEDLQRRLTELRGGSARSPGSGRAAGRPYDECSGHRPPLQRRPTPAARRHCSMGVPPASPRDEIGLLGAPNRALNHKNADHVNRWTLAGGMKMPVKPFHSGRAAATSTPGRTRRPRGRPSGESSSICNFLLNKRLRKYMPAESQASSSLQATAQPIKPAPPDAKKPERVTSIWAELVPAPPRQIGCRTDPRRLPLIIGTRSRPRGRGLEVL
jgi:hypothetical protein